MIIDKRLLKYTTAFGKCIIKGDSRLHYFKSVRRKSNGKFWMRITSMNFPHESGWHKPFFRSLALADFKYLELK